MLIRNLSSRSQRYLLLTVILIGLSTVAMRIAYDHIQVSAFSLTGLAPIFAGWFLGRRAGAISGLFMSVIAFSMMLSLDFPTSEALGTTMVGCSFVVFTGYGFGSLRRLSARLLEESTERAKAERKQEKLQEQLQQSQKMEAIGTLAGGVAHDLNNVLGVIMSTASLIESELPKSSPHYEGIQDIIAACNQGRDFTRNLLGFARKGKYHKEFISIPEVIEKTQKLLLHTVDKRIRLISKMSDNLDYIQGDKSQIEQALMNTCINAVEAIEGQGSITISAEPLTCSQPSAMGSSILTKGKYIKVQVADDGIGMDKATRKRVFEPFFTTKEFGKGTGLGLSMVYGTVTNHGGSVDIESDAGEGTRVTLYLPAFKKQKDEPKMQPSIEMKLGKGTILLVDDEPLIQTSCGRMLKKLGYNVVMADNGSEALDLYRSNEKPIFLVILDFIMPEMDGIETFQKLKELDPDVRVLISSGYSKDEKMEALLKSGAVGFVQKPFSLKEISETISNLSKS